MIDFNRPAFVGKELEYINDAVKRGMLCGDVCRTGIFRDKCTYNGASFLIFFQLFIAESRKNYQKKNRRVF